MDIRKRINTLLDKDITLRHRDVVESFRKNLLKWGSLSARQVDYFKSIEAKYTDEVLQEKADFGRKLKEDIEFQNMLRLKLVIKLYILKCQV